jgi:hypothetical protein
VVLGGVPSAQLNYDETSFLPAFDVAVDENAQEREVLFEKFRKIRASSELYLADKLLNSWVQYTVIEHHNRRPHVAILGGLLGTTRLYMNLGFAPGTITSRVTQDASQARK